MAGSSLRNSIHRRNHKERSQPLSRTKLGLLEKKKDYILRARDFHSKKDRLRLLREKAAFRNKDEFYFGMVNARTQGGVHVKEREGSRIVEQEEVRLLKSQDAGYVRVMIASDENKINALKAQLQILTSLFPSTSTLHPNSTNSTASSSKLPFDPAEADWADFDMDHLPSDTSSMDEDASEEEDDDKDEDGGEEEITLETLIEAGIAQMPREEKSGRGKGKGKGKNNSGVEVGRGHVIFADDQDELFNYGTSLSTDPNSNPSAIPNALKSEPPSSPIPGEELIDLGWKAPKVKQPKTKGQGKGNTAAAGKGGEKGLKTGGDAGMDVKGMGEMKLSEARKEQRRAERELRLEAKDHQNLLLLELQQRLHRLTRLRSVLTQIETQRALMGKGAAIKKREHQKAVVAMPGLRKGRAAREGKRDDVDSGDEGEGEGRVEYRNKVFKWKGERKR